MKTRYCRWFGVLVCAVVFGSCLQVQADDQVLEGEALAANEQSTFQNPAQAQHAANVTEAAVAAMDQEVAEARQDMLDAEADLQAAEDTGDQLEIAEATAQFYLAEAAYTAKVAEITGFRPSEIEGYRATGMGWGEIAHTLGVHPGVLGLGHAKKAGREVELAMATTTDMRSGNSTGHGKASGGTERGANPGGKGNNGKAGDKDKGDKGGNGQGNGNGNSNRK